MILLTFSKISIYLIETFFLLLKNKYISVLIKIYLFIIICGRNMHEALIFVTSEIFKILFTKRKPVRCYYFIHVYILYQNRAFMLMKLVFFSFSIIKFYIFFTHFVSGFNFICNCLNI